MAEPVVVVESGGTPVVDATPLSGTPGTTAATFGIPLTPVESGARPVTITETHGHPVVFVSADGTEFMPGGGGGVEPDFAPTYHIYGF